jgi:predicted nucleic acid-binding protein
MIFYLDTSALVKRYIAERGTNLTQQALANAALAGTSIISRAEMAAALAKAIRVGALGREAAISALQVFRSEWPRLVRVQATELLMAQADTLAWDHGLRGYDAVHLASALTWQQGLDQAVTFATFDRRLWETAGQQGLSAHPADLPALLDSWRGEPAGEDQGDESSAQPMTSSS